MLRSQRLICICLFAPTKRVGFRATMHKRTEPPAQETTSEKFLPRKTSRRPETTTKLRGPDALDVGIRPLSRRRVAHCGAAFSVDFAALHRTGLVGRWPAARESALKTDLRSGAPGRWQVGGGKHRVGRAPLLGRLGFAAKKAGQSSASLPTLMQRSMCRGEPVEPRRQSIAAPVWADKSRKEFLHAADDP